MKAKRFIRAAIAAGGSTKQTAAHLGLSSSAVSAWARRGRVPARWVEPLCRLGGVVQASDVLIAMAQERINPPLSALDCAPER